MRGGKGREREGRVAPNWGVGNLDPPLSIRTDRHTYIIRAYMGAVLYGELFINRLFY